MIGKVSLCKNAIKKNERTYSWNKHIAENARERLRRAVLLFCCLMDLGDDKYLHKRCIPETRVFVVITSLRVIVCYAIRSRRRHEVQGQRTFELEIFSAERVLYIILLVIDT